MSPAIDLFSALLSEGITRHSHIAFWNYRQLYFLSFRENLHA